MQTVQKMPTSQCNSAKMITVLKELFAEHGIPEEIQSDNQTLFAEHGIPEEIQSDNGSQFASHLFAEFTNGSM